MDINMEQEKVNMDYVNHDKVRITDEMYLALKEFEDEVAAGRCEFYDAEEVMKEYLKQLG